MMNLSRLCLAVGGKEDLRPYWQRYMSKALLLVFVIDASNPQLFPVAKKHLHEVLESRPSLPLMVLANKQVSVIRKRPSRRSWRLSVQLQGSSDLVLVVFLIIFYMIFYIKIINLDPPHCFHLHIF